MNNIVLSVLQLQVSVGYCRWNDFGWLYVHCWKHIFSGNCLWWESVTDFV